MSELETTRSSSQCQQCQGRSQADVPQWLNEIRDNSTWTDTDDERSSETQIDQQEKQATDSQSRRSSLLNFYDGLYTYDVPATSESLILSRPNSSARFGRRAQNQTPFSKQLVAVTTPSNSTVSSSDYIVPKFEDYNFQSALTSKENMPNWNDDKLEKSWRSLTMFQQRHKGRLDSAKHLHVMDRKRLGENFDSTLSPISPTNSTNSSNESAYSPSMCDPDVPNLRSRSEMSTYMPQYVYSKIRKATEGNNILTQNMLSKTINNFNTISKSKSTENILMGYHTRSKEKDRKEFHGSEESLNSSRLSEYKMNVARENELRQQIINELLLENEKISSKKKQGKFRRKMSDDLFIIPELPTGRQLKIAILTTWGDKYYVGLNGIEIFGEDGKIINVKKIIASPSDVNILPECSNDPRVVTNLLDGVNRTQDDVHLWLAPFTKGEDHEIIIEFEEAQVISMIRFWNYNKSRIHSYRGARDVVMELDGKKIFIGEIAKACGGIIGGVDAFGDTILFTVNDDILEAISQNDHAFPTLTSDKMDSPSLREERPLTSALATSNGIRPHTGQSPFTRENDDTEQILLGCKKMDIVLISNWGYADVIGLTGIEIIEAGELPVPIKEDYFVCGMASNLVLQRRLFDDENVTTDPNHMWLAKYKYGQHLRITLEFDRFIYIAGLRMWNYNANTEMTYAGVSRLTILLDDRPVSNPLTKDAVFLMRRAPGNVNYDFVQEILLGDSNSLVHTVERVPSFIISNNLNNAQGSPLLPEGFVFEIVVYSTWGDQYYCGLNGLEIYDFKGRKLVLDESNVCAYPESINVLQDVSGDIRTPDKLIDNINDDNDGVHSWLAPIVPKSLNRIYIVLDQPMSVSVIKFWNYSKTPSRGIKEFGILLDDLLIYNGILDKFSVRDKCKYRTVVFNDDLKVVEDDSNTLIKRKANMSIRTATSGSLPSADPALRPFTAVSPYHRTAQSQ